MRRSPRWFVFGFTCSLAVQVATALLWMRRGEQPGLLVLSETMALLLDFIAAPRLARTASLWAG